MKKAIVAALAAGALVLSGCAKTEVTEVSDSRAISFSNFVTSSVKSIDGLGGLEAFYVYGGYEGNWALFNNQKVTKSGTLLIGCLTQQLIIFHLHFRTWTILTLI